MGIKKKTNAVTVIMYLSELASLGLFFFLFKEHMLVKWIYVFLAALLVSPIISRFYCGWICPIHTLMKVEDFIYEKLHVKKLPTPKFMTNKFFRFLFLFLFIGTFIVTKMLKIKVDVLLYAIGIALIVNLIFDGEFWHRYLCPYGSLLSLFSKKPALKLKIDESKCIGCGMCQRVCPTNTIVTLDNKKRRIESVECLTCFECQRVCPVEAIKYGSKEIKS